MTSSEADPEPGSLVVRTDRATIVIPPRAGAAVIGRDPRAQVRIDDSRISRMHVRLELVDDVWRAEDTSSNGMFVGASRAHTIAISDGTALRLGDPAGGPEVRFEIAPRRAADEDEPTVALHPGMVRAGAAAAARRRELDISQRSLAADGVINAGALIAFEKGRSWPRERTRARLEEVLQWPAGTIAELKDGRVPRPERDVEARVPAAVGSDESALIAQAVETAVSALGATINALPPLDDDAFTPRAGAVLADLRQLEAVASGAARIGRVTPALIKALSTVRREIDELTRLASTAPTATLGQRLYAARRSANLTIGETAQAAGVPEDALAAAEADQPVPVATAELIEALLAQLV